MSQFTPENNVLVGTIPDIKPILLPEGNPFTSRVMQFEKMEISAPESLHSTINFWIHLTEAAKNAYADLEMNAPVLNAQTPFLKDAELLPYFPNVFKHIVAALNAKKLSTEVKAVLTAMADLSDETLISYAKTLLGQSSDEIAKEYLPFLSIALKAVYVKSATLATLPKLEVEQGFHDCPMCGDAPIASVLDPMDNGLRYLVCNNCETKWHKVRSTCHSCPNTGKIELLSLEGQESPMKAESCPECHAYIKHLDRTKNPMLDVYVEDLATLALDFTLAEENQQRLSMNLYLR
ncbi:formate dehydrogenase accessory protein FdhE [Wohlfahrtiimonas sp. G9077]|uniref:formate dehydrogenase accessory protein FdhE n=1 Tax=Wohlfahrtiimonas sp. G9077 TaxID=1980118 RepID=UPI000B984D4F|nr:formate dehydrogenase accessory protein FdhE [Wohlfahrtiimonas sp. G9077]OYQ75273.1 formate dehydrogenase accessory protein FdhE [Wohlfahrtiimonas sp. G9077]